MKRVLKRVSQNDNVHKTVEEKKRGTFSLYTFLVSKFDKSRIKNAKKAENNNFRKNTTHAY